MVLEEVVRKYSYGLIKMILLCWRNDFKSPILC